MIDNDSDFENQVVHFKHENETDPSPSSLLEPRLKRRGRPSHNPSEPVRPQKSINNRVRREIQKNVMANKGDGSLAPWAQNAFCLPSEAHARFERGGWVTLFSPLDDMSLRMRENEGWRGVLLEEVPEWTVSQIPSIGQNSDIYRKFVICIDQILMKIEVERHEQLKKFVQNERDQTRVMIRKARQNSQVNPLMLNQSHSLNLSKPRG